MTITKLHTQHLREILSPLRCFLIASICIFHLSSTLFAGEINKSRPIPIIVGGYIYEPIVNSSASGLTQSVIAALNKHQKKYQFTFKLFPAEQRYSEMSTGRIDMIFFESPKWGWKIQPEEYQITKPVVIIRDIMISRSDNRHGLDVFKKLKYRKIAAISGFHYAFANYISEPYFLRKRFKIRLVDNLNEILSLVLSNKSDIGLVTDLYLFKQFDRQKDLRKKIQIGREPDQQYQLPIIVGRQSPLSFEKFQQLMNDMISEGKFKNIIPKRNLLLPK